VIGTQITLAPRLVSIFDPTRYITADDPPFFIEHGTQDMTVPYLQSVVFADALYKILGKKKVTIHLLEGVAHLGPEYSATKNLDEIFAFLDKYIKN
jgi:dipeptidyl aminopeptidase/acylaminoacyl peptidase